AVSPERSGAAIYRFDGVAWSSGAVSNQLFEPGRDGAAASVAGSIVRSGRYAVFSLGRDTRPPSTEFSITGGSRVASGIVLASTASFVVLRASDELQDGYSSQVATTYYRIDKLSPLDPFAVYKSSIPLSLGAHTIEYRSQDWMGNLVEVRTSSVVVTAGDVFKEERGRTVEGRLLVGFMDSGAQVEVESQAQSDHTFMVSGADGMPLMAADNIGRVSLGGARARAQVDVAANDLSIALQLRNGAFRSMPGGPQLALGYSYPAQMRHAIATDHGADPKDNGIDFMIWTPKLSSAAIATERFLSLQEMSWNAASFHVCPVGRADAEVEVSNLAAKGGGSMRRFELQTPAFLGPEPGEDIEELLRHKAYETVLQLRHASYTYPDDPSTRREGLLFKDAPESIRGKGGVVLLDTRVANLELALQESMKRLEGLKRRLAALRGHR
ncbi:MAG TPA: hypothetical protein VNI01_05455, partial [Elusimicrobiota bacterium]|nr:hypothetical protein [Elusimicrobiota bacterium]